MYNRPDWYVTPQEFADLVVETTEELQYFKADEFYHPEDIVITFQTISEAIAKGMGYVGRRVAQADKNKKAMMQTKDLRK